MAVVVFFLIRSLFIFSCMYIHTRERHDFFNGVLSLASYMYNKSYSASNSFISYTQEKKKKKQERNKTNTTHSRYLMARDENNQIKIKIVIVIVTLQSNQMRGIGGGNTHHGSIFIFESIGRKQHVDTKNTQYFIIYFFLNMMKSRVRAHIHPSNFVFFLLGSLLHRQRRPLYLKRRTRTRTFVYKKSNKLNTHAFEQSERTKQKTRTGSLFCFLIFYAYRIWEGKHFLNYWVSCLFCSFWSQ